MRRGLGIFAIAALANLAATQASAADRIVFSGLEELRGVFQPQIGEELLAEEQPPHAATNEQGTEIARLVFRLKKES